MAQELSEIIPPLMQKRMEKVGIKSVRQLEREMQTSNAAIRKYLSNDKTSVRLLVSLLHTLGYECKSPEFELIYEICGSKDLNGVAVSPTISTVKKQQSRRIRKEQILYLMFPGLTKSA